MIFGIFQTPNQNWLKNLEKNQQLLSTNFLSTFEEILAHRDARRKIQTLIKIQVFTSVS